MRPADHAHVVTWEGGKEPRQLTRSSGVHMRRQKLIDNDHRSTRNPVSRCLDAGCRHR
jgi:hypothetical protein